MKNCFRLNLATYPPRQKKNAHILTIFRSMVLSIVPVYAFFIHFLIAFSGKICGSFRVRVKGTVDAVILAFQYLSSDVVIFFFVIFPFFFFYFFSFMY